MVHVDSSNVTNEDNNNYFKFDKLVLYEKNYITKNNLCRSSHNIKKKRTRE